MNFTLSPEQVLLRESVARFATGGGARTTSWKTFGELGWRAIGVPDEIGGFGGPVETLLLMEQLGRGLVVSPCIGQVVFAGALLRAVGRLDCSTRSRRPAALRGSLRRTACTLRSGARRRRRNRKAMVGS